MRGSSRYQQVMCLYAITRRRDGSRDLSSSDLLGHHSLKVLERVTRSTASEGEKISNVLDTEQPLRSLHGEVGQLSVHVCSE